MKTVAPLAAFLSALLNHARDRGSQACHRLRRRPMPRIGLALGGGIRARHRARGVLAGIRTARAFRCIASPVSARVDRRRRLCQRGDRPRRSRAPDCAMRLRPRGALEPVPHWVRRQRADEAVPRAAAEGRARFEDMWIPLGSVGDGSLYGAKPSCFAIAGDVVLPIRASCSYPGLFQPVQLRRTAHSLVDGAMSVEIPARLARHFGATACSLRTSSGAGRRQGSPQNIFQVDQPVRFRSCRREQRGELETGERPGSDARRDTDRMGRLRVGSGDAESRRGCRGRGAAGNPRVVPGEGECWSAAPRGAQTAGGLGFDTEARRHGVSITVFLVPSVSVSNGRPSTPDLGSV